MLHDLSKNTDEAHWPVAPWVFLPPFPENGNDISPLPVTQDFSWQPWLFKNISRAGYRRAKVDMSFTNKLILLAPVSSKNYRKVSQSSLTLLSRSLALWEQWKNTTTSFLLPYLPTCIYPCGGWKKILTSCSNVELDKVRTVTGGPGLPVAFIHRFYCEEKIIQIREQRWKLQFIFEWMKCLIRTVPKRLINAVTSYSINHYIPCKLWQVKL